MEPGSGDLEGVNYSESLSNTIGVVTAVAMGEDSKQCRGGGADLTKIQPAGIRTKSGGARSIEDGKGPSASGMTPNPTTAA